MRILLKVLNAIIRVLTAFDSFEDVLPKPGYVRVGGKRVPYREEIAGMDPGCRHPLTTRLFQAAMREHDHLYWHGPQTVHEVHGVGSVQNWFIDRTSRSYWLSTGRGRPEVTALPVSALQITDATGEPVFERSEMVNGEKSIVLRVKATK